MLKGGEIFTYSEENKDIFGVIYGTQEPDLYKVLQMVVDTNNDTIMREVLTVMSDLDEYLEEKKASIVPSEQFKKVLVLEMLKGVDDGTYGEFKNILKRYMK